MNYGDFERELDTLASSLLLQYSLFIDDIMRTGIESAFLTDT